MATQVGQDMLSYCTRCKMDLTHSVVAVIGDRVKRVLCQTCNKEHAFRLPAGLRALSVKERAAKSAALDKARCAADEWVTDIARTKAHSAKPYTLDGLYKMGQKLDHRTFGLGMVKNMIAPNKMEVLFEDGMKMLIRGEALKISR
jgi:hypothetical protein